MPSHLLAPVLSRIGFIISISPARNVEWYGALKEHVRCATGNAIENARCETDERAVIRRLITDLILSINTGTAERVVN